MNYFDLKSEIEDDIKDGILTLEDTIYVFRRSQAIDGYYPIIDFEYSPIDEEDQEAMLVSEVLKEMQSKTLKIIK